MPALVPHRRHVVVDTDTGIDDALALIHLAAQPDVQVVAVGTTHGNCRTEQATANALRVLEACGLGDVPVAEGLRAPLEQPLDVAWHVHGHDGLGDTLLPAPAGAPSGEGAVEQLLRLSHEHAGQLDLLALGPLTNLGAALRIDPEVLTRFRAVVIMGGAGPELAPGAHDPFVAIGDPNTYHDEAAAELVYAAAGPLTLVPVDVTTPVLLDEEQLAHVAASAEPQAVLATRILAGYVAYYATLTGRRVCSMHDPLAAGVLVDPATVLEIGEGPIALRPNVDGRARAWMERAPRADRRAHRVVHAVDADRFTTAMVASLVLPLPSR